MYFPSKEVQRRKRECQLINLQEKGFKSWESILFLEDQLFLIPFKYLFSLHFLGEVVSSGLPFYIRQQCTEFCDAKASSLSYSHLP